ncbi:hypothetical protein CWATWH0401_308 [Crocosphaera watsonii WH 0401]|uniref:Uncharacterized protein n=1 Tax=Crocosphaera watsonii WH 0401 TaxID=555881 RepID=T2J3L2_CROWT|nr:hypothetical protein CWATWH0401_308 [Crocosphaera watsonii WH 0401]
MNSKNPWWLDTKGGKLGEIQCNENLFSNLLEMPVSFLL